MINVIEEFINNKNIAIVGASRDRKKWGNMLFRLLKKKGYMVHPINPNAEEIEGVKCFSTVKELPKEVTNVILSVQSEVSEQVVKECSQAGIKRVWMHKGAGNKGSQSKIAIQFCKHNGIEVVYDLCPMMFFPHAGIHKVHFWIKKITGRLPEGFAT